MNFIGSRLSPSTLLFETINATIEAENLPDLVNAA